MRRALRPGLQHPGIVLALAAAFVAVLLAGIGPARAALGEADKAALATTVADFTAAMVARDYAKVANIVPPRVMAFMADRAKLDRDKLRQSIVDVMRSMEDQVTITETSMRFAETQYKQLPSGTDYALVPTTTAVLIKAKGATVRIKSWSLALRDEGKWYMLNVNQDKQIAILRSVYPEFDGVDLPRSTSEVLQ